MIYVCICGNRTDQDAESTDVKAGLATVIVVSVEVSEVEFLSTLLGAVSAGFASFSSGVAVFHIFALKKLKSELINSTLHCHTAFDLYQPYL